jgi:ABC-2 type transport system ATP-binding protein
MIRFNQLKKTFRRQAVLDGINLDIAPGDRIALVGSNGAGKTTLIRCLLGEYTYEGEVQINGLAPRPNRKEVLARVGFVPQLPPPLKMPVGQLIRFSAGVCGSDPQRMYDVAARLGLDVSAIRRQPFVKLSGGMKQKLLIGIALGRDSDLLVLDEPAANLDPEARHIFFGLLAEKPAGTTMLISSHRLDEVAALVNRVVELDQGKVVLDDHVADSVDLTSVQACRVVLSRAEPAFAKAISSWGFTGSEDGLEWNGQVPGADRLRFLGVLSRYAALLNHISLDEVANDAEAG